MGFDLPDVQLSARIDIEQVTRQGRNVLGWLRAGDVPTPQIVVVGAHIDHLGEGTHSSSLARDDEREGVHWGADDNASGVGRDARNRTMAVDTQGAGQAGLPSGTSCSPPGPARRTG